MNWQPVYEYFCCHRPFSTLLVRVHGCWLVRTPTNIFLGSITLCFVENLVSYKPHSWFMRTLGTTSIYLSCISMDLNQLALSSDAVYGDRPNKDDNLVDRA
jgi:hypothetical protein